MGDSREKDLSLNRSEKYHKWSLSLLESTLALCALYPSAPSSQGRNTTDRRNHRLHRRRLQLSMIITVYLASKCLTILLLRGIRGRSLDEHLVNFLDAIRKLIGDPYSHLPFASSLMYLMPSLVSLWLNCYLPIHTSYAQSYKCSFLRFMLDPEREVQEFDIEASSLLRSAIETFECRRQKFLHGLRISMNHWSNTGNRLDSIEQSLYTMRKINQQISSIRPKCLRSAWYECSHKIVSLLFAIPTTVSVIFVFLVMIYLSLFAWRGRCKALPLPLIAVHGRNQTGCALGEAFSRPDLMLLLEMNFFTIPLVVVPCQAVINIHVLAVRHQLYLIRNISGKLTKLVGQVCNHNQKGQLKVGERRLDDRLRYRLCANIVRVWMFQRESRRCIRMLAYHAEFVVAVLFVFTIVALTSSNTQVISQNLNSVKSGGLAEVSARLRLNKVILSCVWLLAWLLANTILFSCALITAQITRLNRTIYSLVAHLAEHKDKKTLKIIGGRRFDDNHSSTNDPITSFWLRIILSDKCAEDQMSVRAFKSKITFKSLLVVNLHVASALSLLYHRIS